MSLNAFLTVSRVDRRFAIIAITATTAVAIGPTRETS
jgi:hypothetical protein